MEIVEWWRGFWFGYEGKSESFESILGLVCQFRLNIKLDNTRSKYLTYVRYVVWNLEGRIRYYQLLNSPIADLLMFYAPFAEYTVFLYETVIIAYSCFLCLLQHDDYSSLRFRRLHVTLFHRAVWTFIGGTHGYKHKKNFSDDRFSIAKLHYAMTSCVTAATGYWKTPLSFDLSSPRLY